MKTAAVAQHAARSAVWALAQNMARPLISLVIFVTLARALEPEAYGLVALAGAVVTLITVLVEQGFNDALVQRDLLEPGHLNAAFWLGLASSCGLMLLLMVGAPVIALLLGQPELARVLATLAWLLPIQAFAIVPQAILQRGFAYRTLALRTLLGNAAGGAAGIALAWQGHGVWSLVAQQLVQAATGTLILWAGCHWRPGLAFRFGQAAELYRFGRHIIGSGLLNFVNRKSDDLIIGIFLGPVALGMYSLAYQVFTFMEQLLCKGFDSLALSAFSRLQDDRARLREALYLAARWSSLLAFPAFIGAALVTPNLVGGFLGSQWLGTVPVIQILMLVGVVHAVLHYNHAVFKACDAPQISVKLAAVEAVANVTLFLVAVHWGILAVAAAYVIRALLMSPLSLREVRCLICIDIRHYVQQLALPLAATTGMVTVVLCVETLFSASLDPRAMLVLLIASGAITYVLSLRFLAPALLGQMRAQVQLARAPAGKPTP